MTAGCTTRRIELTAIHLEKRTVGIEKKVPCIWVIRQRVLATGKWLFSPLHAARVREKAAIFFDLKRLYADSLGWQERNPQGWVALFNMATLATDSTVVKKSIWRSVR